MFKKTATADKPFSPTKSQLSKVAAQTHASAHEYEETVDFLKSQLQSLENKWRCYFKVLVVIEYLLRFGSETCVRWAMENVDTIKALKLFNHVDKKAEFRGKQGCISKTLRSLYCRLTWKKCSTICSKTDRIFALCRNEIKE